MDYDNVDNECSGIMWYNMGNAYNNRNILVINGIFSTTLDP